MHGLTIGITTARDPACKRGLAVNLAAGIARDAVSARRVCVVDADPLTLDVTTRLAARGACLEDYADTGRAPAPLVDELAWVHEPPLWVLPSAGGGVGLTHRAVTRVLPALRADFDVVICDLVGGPAGPARVVSDRLGGLDWLLLAVTPETGAVDAAARFLDQFESARELGHVADSVRLGVVTTGDEGSTDLTADAVAQRLGQPLLGAIRQLWGRAVPNLGFGAALGIGELDTAVDALFERLRAPHETELSLAAGADRPYSRAS